MLDHLSHDRDEDLPADPTLLEELAVTGYRPFEEHDDPRPLPDKRAMDEALRQAMAELERAFAGTRLEDDLEDVLWGFVNVFHRRVEGIERKLDENEQAQRQSQREQDGSEVLSVELERLTALGLTLSERRNAFEYARDAAAHVFTRTTRSLWRPRSGSQVNRATMTAAMIDSRDYISARRRAETEIHLPQGTRIAFTGGKQFQDVAVIWDTLDRVRAKHADMVLLHGGGEGAELIAAKWAETRKVAQVVFRPDWKRHSKAAPFRRNDAILEQLPIGVVHFPGGGISDNLADKALTKGIPVRRGVKTGA
ncbi:DUF2493 domain-containing protein [Methylobacterium sp. NEAU 140]|uniref:DUF2493 domain-containing protein n=1 Tax=Methylobacterium sp. NEAU 140 TaxID=3064945 RepID=UPI002735A68B|nr:DUF2493 domain-containing protein [Methylobacterium sp. NEAU 140]MDP4025756.1 DUF2493 domain-containing protein [Methylobacterium sp. NEAU 140]